jgi:hypothetical protein
VDKWLWFVEAHQQGAPSELIANPADGEVVPRRSTPRTNGDTSPGRTPRRPAGTIGGLLPADEANDEGLDDTGRLTSPRRSITTSLFHETS